MVASAVAIGAIDKSCISDSVRCASVRSESRIADLVIGCAIVGKCGVPDAVVRRSVAAESGVADAVVRSAVARKSCVADSVVGLRGSGQSKSKAKYGECKFDHDHPFDD